MDGAILKKQIAILTLFLVAEPCLLFAQPAFHVVKPGESLSGIAEKYFGRTINVFHPKTGALAKLMALNPQIKDRRKVAPGVKLFLANQKNPPKAEAKLAAPEKKPAEVIVPEITTYALNSEPSTNKPSSGPVEVVPSPGPAMEVREPASPNELYPADFFKGKLDGSVESQATITDTSTAYPSNFFSSPATVEAEQEAPPIIVERESATETVVNTSVPTATMTVTAEDPYPTGFLKGAPATEEASTPPLATVTSTTDPYPLHLMQKAPDGPTQEVSPLKIEQKTIDEKITSKKAPAKKAAEAKPVNPDSDDPMDRYPPGFMGKDPSEVSTEEAESAPPAKLPSPVKSDAEIAKPAEVAAPAEITMPVEEAKPSKVAKPVEAVKPEVVATPIEAPKGNGIQETDPMDRYPKGFLGTPVTPDPVPSLAPSPGPAPVQVPSNAYVEPTYVEPAPVSSPAYNGGYSYTGGGGGGGSSSGGGGGSSYGSYSSGSYSSGSSYSSSSSSSYSSDARFPHSKFTVDLGLDYFRLEARVPRSGGRAVLSSAASPQTRFNWDFGWSEQWRYRLRFNYTADQQQTGATAATISGGNGPRYGYSVGAIRHWAGDSRTAFTVGSSTRIFLRSTSVSSVNADRAQLLGLTVDQEFDLLQGNGVRGGVAFQASLISAGTGAGYTMGMGYGAGIAGYLRHELAKDWDTRGELYYSFSKQNTSLIDQKEQHMGLYFGLSKRFE